MVAPTAEMRALLSKPALTPMMVEFSLHRLRREGFIEASFEPNGVTSYRILYGVDPQDPDQVVLQPRKVARSGSDDGEEVRIRPRKAVPSVVEEDDPYQARTL
jgi:hypothetical protein